MGIFDFFRKHQNEKQEDVIPESLSNGYGCKDVDISCEDLYHVYENNIRNGEFVVPEVVKRISSHAFYNQKTLQVLKLHNGIRYIAPLAFKNCTSLHTIQGLENNEQIKTLDGFSGCENLEHIDIPQSVQMISQGAFKDCKKLDNITLPNGLWSVSSYSFAGCESLKHIEIPPTVELIESFAFAGCKNLTLVFLEDDSTTYLSDYIKESKENIGDGHEDIESDFIEDFDTSSDDEEEFLDDNAREQLYNDLGIKYRKFDIAGKEFLWPSGKIIIKPDALLGVKEVIASSQETIGKVLKSGYRGKVTYFDKKNNQSISMDIKYLEELEKNKQKEEREKHIDHSLIPKGGTMSWLDVCKKYNYHASGYSGDILKEIKISQSCRLVVEDYTQPTAGSNKYNPEREEFFTCVTFYKKELDNHSVYAPHVYERGDSIYYPYGTRFNEKLLTEICMALNILIDNARYLAPVTANEPRIRELQNRQKQLLSLFMTGTNDTEAVSKIMKGINLYRPSTDILEAKDKKDWLVNIDEYRDKNLNR